MKQRPDRIKTQAALPMIITPQIDTPMPSSDCSDRVELRQDDVCPYRPKWERSTKVGADTAAFQPNERQTDSPPPAHGGHTPSLTRRYWKNGMDRSTRSTADVPEPRPETFQPQHCGTGLRVEQRRQELDGPTVPGRR